MKLKSILVVAVSVVFTLAMVISVVSVKPTASVAGQLKKFNSYEELEKYIKVNRELVAKYGMFGRFALGDVIRAGASEESKAADVAQNTASAAPQRLKKESGIPGGGSLDYSTTNIQVEGVDEADIVKSDGKYLYVVAGGQVAIVEAYPADKARVVARIDCRKVADVEGYPAAKVKVIANDITRAFPAEIFINKDKLVVVGSGGGYGEVFINVYDVKDKTKPALVRSLSSEGSYVNSRMIGDYAYLVLNVPVTSGVVKATGEEKIELPRVVADTGIINVQPSEIQYFDYPDNSYRYTMILSVNTQNEKERVGIKTFLTGTSQNIFASEKNIYLTNRKTPDLEALTSKYIDGLAGIVPPAVGSKIKEVRASKPDLENMMNRVEDIIEDYIDSLGYTEAIALEEKIQQYREKYYRDAARDRDNTIIHKLSVQNGAVTYKCRGEVPGSLLNQFSMDEHEGYFRVATTSESFVFGQDTKNNIFVLDENMKTVGELKGLARSERIYSARFMGDRLYLVTFRRIDPLFVIDLKDPKSPRVLGELKIPGYSDYLHPYDEKHIIGIGKEVEAMPEPPVVRPMGPAPRVDIIPQPVRPQGVKIALFDVSNPAKPREIAKYVVDQESSHSPALHDHRAFLFSRDRNLLAIPVTYWLPPEESGNAKVLPPYYQRQWQGVYVFNISLDKGISLKGKIEHKNVSPEKMVHGGEVKRSLYIEDVLYTLSDSLLKINQLDSLREIKDVKLVS